MATQPQMPFVLLLVNGNLYAVATEFVREILIMPEVVSIPRAPAEVRGVIKLRGSVIKLVDLRVKLGFPSARTELDGLLQLLRDREADHRNWLSELEACVREQRPFQLARDPHQCKFGKWYDQYQTEDGLLRMTLRKMDRPHQIIHATAKTVLEQAELGDLAGALALLEERRNLELAALMRLFEEARAILAEHHREVVVVLSHRNQRLALSVDLVEAVERIPDENLEAIPELLARLNRGLRGQMAKRNKTNQTMMVLEEPFFFEPTPAASPDEPLACRPLSLLSSAA